MTLNDILKHVAEVAGNGSLCYQMVLKMIPLPMRAECVDLKRDAGRGCLGMFLGNALVAEFDESEMGAYGCKGPNHLGNHRPGDPGVSGGAVDLDGKRSVRSR